MTYGGGLSDIASGQAPRSRHIRLVTNTLASGKPLTEQGEESDNPLAGIMFVDTRQLRIQPFEPRFAFALHDRTDETLFRSKMVVERPAGDAGFGDDPIDARGVNAIFIE